MATTLTPRWATVALAMCLMAAPAVAGCGSSAGSPRAAPPSGLASLSVGDSSLYIADVDGPPVDLLIGGLIVAWVPCSGYTTLTPGRDVVPALPWSLDVRRQGGAVIKHLDVTAAAGFMLLIRADTVALWQFGSTGPSADPNACARWSAQSSASASPSSGAAASGAGITQDQAFALARQFYDGAHGTGARVVGVGETIAPDQRAGRAGWHVKIDGSVIEAGQSSPGYGSVMWLFVDGETGAITVVAEG